MIIIANENRLLLISLLKIYLLLGYLIVVGKRSIDYDESKNKDLLYVKALLYFQINNKIYCLVLNKVQKEAR